MTIRSKLVWAAIAAALVAGAPGCSQAPSKEKPSLSQPAGEPKPRWPVPTKAQEKAAEAGDPEAMYAVARHLGEQAKVAPVAVTTPEGVALLEASAKKGYVPAQAALGWRLVHEDDAATQAHGVQLIQAAAEAGDAGGQSYLAFLEWEGKGVAKDEQAALRHFEAAAEKHWPEAEYQLAIWYTNGTIVKQDHDKARALYLRAYEHGEAEALEYGRTRLDAGFFEKVWQWMNAT